MIPLEVTGYLEHQGQTGTGILIIAISIKTRAIFMLFLRNSVQQLKPHEMESDHQNVTESSVSLWIRQGTLFYSPTKMAFNWREAKGQDEINVKDEISRKKLGGKRKIIYHIVSFLLVCVASTMLWLWYKSVPWEEKKNLAICSLLMHRYLHFFFFFPFKSKLSPCKTNCWNRKHMRPTQRDLLLFFQGKMTEYDSKVVGLIVEKSKEILKTD